MEVVDETEALQRFFEGKASAKPGHVAQGGEEGEASPVSFSATLGFGGLAAREDGGPPPRVTRVASSTAGVWWQR